MMTVPMDNSLAPASWELAERLHKKNSELETELRRSAKSKVPSDPNHWYRIRENYEAIILEDHDYSEKHDIELSLWQLHYRRIEEFRALINAAKSAGSVTSQGGKNPARPDSIKKILSTFKTFLSESTGFYHDLLLKIKAKFGLPLGFFSDGPESENTLAKDEKKSFSMKQGLLSCHRCLIYLGDLARYKGVYGEGDSVSREYVAASSYYKQAASLCPSNGNPHHQLAILASYSGDDLVSIYRYFRSLAAETPFTTARDNLIIAFEKNRQSFSQLPGNAKAIPSKVTVRSTGRGRGRGGARLSAKDTKLDASPTKECVQNIPEILKAFSTRFVRLNGILFTRTSMETFREIFSSVKSDLRNLLSSGPEEVLNFGQDTSGNGLLVVRLIAILIFTVHNVKKESEGQSYAEILQRTVLLQNAFTAAFDFAGHIIKRCIQLCNPSSSFLLPAISVFIEWLACHPDIAAGIDVDDSQATARSFFWNQFVTIMNKLLSSGLASYDGDADETCFFDMSQYDERETGNRLALWEDFELRGFLPLVPAQIILDFSSKYSPGGNGGEKAIQARVQRILAAGRVLMNVVRVDQKIIYFDPHLKKFVIGVEPPVFDECMLKGLSDAPVLNVAKHASPVDNNFNLGITPTKAELFVDGDDEEEEIVFKPTVVEKYHPNASSSVSAANTTTQDAQIFSKDQWGNYSTLSTPVTSFQMLSFPQGPQQPLQHINLNSSKWLMEQAAVLSNGLKNFNVNENGLLTNNHGSVEGSNSMQSSTYSPLVTSAVLSNGLKNSNANGNGFLTNNHGLQEGLNSLQLSAFSPLVTSAPIDRIGQAFVPSTLDSIMLPGVKFSAILPTTSRKSPVSRPVRHLGPPPGFTNIPPKQGDSSTSEALANGPISQVDDYSWLDGYQSSSVKALRMESSGNHPSIDNAKLNGTMNFPFPGKQMSTMQIPAVNGSKWQEFQLFDSTLEPNTEHRVQQINFQNAMLPEQHQTQSIWSGRYFV